MRDAPQQPGHEAAEAAATRNRTTASLAADRCEIARVAIANGAGGGLPAMRAAMTLATYRPCCLATGATPGNGAVRAGDLAVSPITKISDARHRQVGLHVHPPGPIASTPSQRPPATP